MISSLYVHPGTLNVGIGTSMPLATLDVNGTIRASNISIIGDFVILNTVTSNTEQMVIQNAGTGPALKVTQTGANSIAEFYDDGNVLALKIADGGNVGIGTAIPAQKFHVSGAIKSTMSINSDTQFVGPATDSAAAPSFSFIDDTNTGMFKPAADNVAISCGGTERMRVLSNGNVGIGTENPQYKLHTNGGDVCFTLPSTVNNGWRNLIYRGTSLWGDGITTYNTANVYDSGVLYGTVMKAMFQAPHVVADFGGTAYIRYGRAGGVAIGTWWETGTLPNGDFHIRREAITGGMTLTQNENVGIGTTTPVAKLHVNGSIKNTNPCFHAHLNDHAPIGQVIIFSELILNEGNCYNKLNGRFTAPIEGVYQFNFSGMKINTAGYAAVYIRKGGANVIAGHSNDAYFSHVSASLRVKLIVNDYVDVFNVIGYSILHGGIWTSFSGAFLG